LRSTFTEYLSTFVTSRLLSSWGIQFFSIRKIFATSCVKKLHFQWFLFVIQLEQNRAERRNANSSSD